MRRWPTPLNWNYGLAGSRSSERSFQTLIKRGKQHADEQLLSLMPLLADEDPQDVDALMRRLTKPYKNSAKANYAAAATALAG